MNDGVPFSMSAWIKTDFSGGQRVILAKAAGASGNTPALFVDNEGKLRFDNFEVSEVHSNTTVRTGNWMHVAVTYDGSTFRLFVNGVADGERAFRGSNESGNSWTFSIGGSLNTSYPSGMFKGSIDEVQFWSRTLSPAEVATVADSGVSLNPAPSVPFTYSIENEEVTITEYTGTGGAVVIPATIDGNSVTQIGNAAFKEKTSITAITFPDSVTTIGYEAFYHCDNLTSITFGSGLKTIGDWAFAWCGKLPTLIIPDSVTSLGEGAVSDCSALTSLTIGNQVPVIWRFTFSGDSNLTAVTLPASVGSIGEQAFSHCTKLATINFQQSVPPYVNGDAFMDIASGAMGYYLESADMGWSGMSSAGSNSGNALSFNGNNQYLVAGAGTDHVLTTGTIECWIRSDVPVADTDGFHGIMVKQGSYGLFLKGNELIAYDWQNGGERHTFRLLRDERNNAWHHVAMSFQSGVTNGTVIYLDGQPVLTTTYTVGNSGDPLAIGAGFASSSQLFQGMMDEVRVWNIVRTHTQIATYRNVSVPATSSGLVSYFKLDESSGSSAGNAVAGGATATLYNSPSWSPLSISGLTFPQRRASQTINFGAIPTKRNGIGTFDLTATASSGLPVSYASSNESVATVSENTVTILGTGTTSITASQPGDETYAAATTVVQLLTVIPVFEDPSGFHYTLSNNQAKIWRYRGAGGVVTIPATLGGMPVTELADGVFYGNGGITAIRLPASLTKVGDSCFVGCDKLTEVDFRYVTEIGASCFSGCTNLRTVDSIASLTSIPAFLFSGCTSLEKVVLGPGVTSIANNAFHTCEKLTTIITNGQLIPNSLPASLVNLAEAAFANCKKLTQVTFPGSVTEIKSDAFGNCELLSSVSFLGGTPPSVGLNAFNGVASVARGHYPLSASTAWTAALALNPIPGLSFNNNVPSNNSGGPYVAATIGDFALENAPASLPFTVVPANGDGGQSEGKIAWNGTVFSGDSSIIFKSGKDEGGDYSRPELVIWGNIINGTPDVYEGYGGVVGQGTMIGSAGIFITEYNYYRLEFTGRRYLALVANGYYGYADVTVGGANDTDLTVHAVVFNTIKGQAIAAGATPSGLSGETGGGTGTGTGTGTGIGTGTGTGTGGGLSQVSAPVLNLPATLTYGQKMILPGAAQSLQVSKSVNQTIPDGTPESSMSSSATVSGLTGSNYSFTLAVKIVPVENGGGFLGDLRAYLQHELYNDAGQPIKDSSDVIVAQTRMLIDQIGVTQADPDGSMADGLNVIFGDSFSDNIQNASATRGTLLSGNFAPASSSAGTDPAMAGPFSGLGGTSNLWNGTYRLVVADLSTGSEMKLDSWSMQFHSLAASVGAGNPLVVGNPGEFSPEGGLTYEIVESGVGTQENSLGKIDGNQLEAKSGTGTITIRAKYAATLASTASDWTTKTITLSKASQTITFNPPDSVSLFSDYVNLGATTDSGATVTYTSQNTIVATIDTYYLRPQAAGDVDIRADAAGNANYENASTVTKTIHVQATPIRPFLGLSKLFSQDSTNGPVAGVVQGTNTYTYEGIQYAEAPALAGISSVNVSTNTNSYSYFAYLGRMNEIAQGVIGYSGYSNPPSFTSYEGATNQYSDGSYNFIGQNTNYTPMTNTTVTLAWSNSTNAFPSQAPAIQGGPWAANSLKMVAGTNNALAWAAWSNRPTQGTNTIRLEIKTYSPSNPYAQTIITTNLAAYSTNCAITGLTNTNSFYQATLGFVSDDGGAVRVASTQFRIVTGPADPPTSPRIAGANELGILYVNPGAFEVGQLDPIPVGIELSLPSLYYSDGLRFEVDDTGILKLSLGQEPFGSSQTSYSIVLTALDPFTGLYADTAYTVVVKTDVSSQITFVDPPNLTYSVQPKAPSAQAAGVTGFSFKYVSQDGTSYRESSAPPTNAGQYTVTATVTDVDKVGSASKNFEIAKGVQFAVSGSLGSATISFGGTTTVTASGGSGIGAYQFRQNGGTGSVSFTGTGDTTRTINTTTAGTAVIEVRRVADANYNDSAWVSAGTLTVNPANQAAVSGSLGSATISFGGTTTVTASGGSGIGAYEFRQNGGTGSVSFTGTGDTTRTINTTTAGTAVIEVRRVADANYNDSAWVSAGTLTVYDPDLPVPGPDAFAAKLAAGMTTKVTLASLLTNDRPSANLADARTVTLESASLTSTGGASIRVKGGWLIYQPSLGATNGTTDTFTYTVSNGGTKTATETVTVSLVAPDYVAEVAIDRKDGNKVYFSVMPGMTFEVQGSDLTPPVTWSTIPNGSSNWTSGADGRLIVTDPAAVGMASRFYKFRWIP
jgi:hypothetical protein